MPLTTSPYVLKNLSLTLKLKTGGTGQEYRCQLHTAQLTAESNVTDYETFCGNFSTPGITKWTLSLEGFQAVADATDLSMFLLANDGALLTYTLIPQGGTVGPTNPSFSGDCYAVPGSIGGTVNETATFTVDLPCAGTPTVIKA